MGIMTAVAVIDAKKRKEKNGKIRKIK